MSFQICVARVLQSEGGYKAAEPSDPGGETNFGISKRSYPQLNIRTLTAAQASAIYLADFWKPIRGDEMPRALAYQLLDYAVNSGPAAAITGLQRTLAVKADGVLGPITMAAIGQANTPAMVLRLVATRLRYLDRLQNWIPNSVGWSDRISQALRYAAVDIDVAPIQPVTS